MSPTDRLVFAMIIVMCWGGILGGMLYYWECWRSVQDAARRRKEQHGNL